MTKTMTAAGMAGALTVFAAFSSMAAPATQHLETNETNVTVIYKTNPNWPIRGMMSVDPCDVRKCQEI
ncbi:MAG: hypothetical protein AAGA00_09860 [Pseudomonadota bacterium]